MSIDVHYDSYGEILCIIYTPTTFKTAIRILIHSIILLILLVIFMLQILYPRLMIYRGLIETVGFGIVICVIVVLLLLRIRNYILLVLENPTFVFEKEIFKYIPYEGKESIYRWEDLEKITTIIGSCLVFKNGEKILLPEDFFWKKLYNRKAFIKLLDNKFVSKIPKTILGIEISKTAD